MIKFYQANLLLIRKTGKRCRLINSKSESSSLAQVIKSHYRLSHFGQSLDWKTVHVM